MTAIIEELRLAIGSSHVLTDAQCDATNGHDLSAHTTDWRKRYRGRTLALVRPGSTGEVAQVVQACARHGVAIVPQGGNTGLVGGATPDDSGRQVLLHLGRLRQVLEVDPVNATLTAQAGLTLQEAQLAAQSHGLLLPLSLAAEGSATLGGVLSTNAGGTQVLRYGNARELCLGLEVVTAQGEVLQGLSGLRKDNTGYALRELFIGSEGTLGIITAATFKLFPQPAAQLTALASLPSLGAAIALLRRAQRCLGSSLTAFEVVNHPAQQLLQRHFPALTQALPLAPWWVLMEQSDAESDAHAQAQFEALMAEALDAGEVTDAHVAHSQAQSLALWQMREAIPLAQSREGLNIKHDISLPISRIPEFVAHTEAALAQGWPGSRLINFGHLGDGNLHFNLQAPPGTDAQAFLSDHESAVNTLVYDAVIAHGGSISAEHGIGQLKREELALRKDATALDLMRRLKTALDPQGLLNPGKVLPR
jgi:FAD/FMN-containing dehydrogenase